MTSAQKLLFTVLWVSSVSKGSVVQDAFPYIDADSEDLTQDHKNMILEAKQVFNKLEKREQDTTTSAEQKDQLKRVRESFTQSWQGVTTELANDAKETNGKKLFKPSYGKLLNGLSTLNSVYEKVSQTTDSNLRMQGLCEVAGELAQVIPAPVGPVIASIVMIGSVVFGSSTPTSTQSARSVVRGENVLQYIKELSDEVKSEAATIDDTRLDIETRSTEEFETSERCQNGQVGKNSDGTEMTPEQHKIHCDLTAINPVNQASIITEIGIGSNAGTSVVAKVRNAIARESKTIDSMDRLRAIRELLAMCAELSSLRFVMFTEMKLFVDKYMPNATHYLRKEELSRTRDAQNFESWIESTLGGTEYPMQSILALYLLRNPVPGMELITKKLTNIMESLLEQNGNHNFKIRGQKNALFRSFKDYGFYIYSYTKWTPLPETRHYDYVGTCMTIHRRRRRRYAQGNSHAEKPYDRCLPNSRELYLEKYSTKMSDGLIISQASQRDTTWGIDDENYLVPKKREKGISAFAFHPVVNKGEKEWFMMVTRKNGERPEKFSFVYSTKENLYADDEEFNWFKDPTPLFFKIEPYSQN